MVHGSRCRSLKRRVGTLMAANLSQLSRLKHNHFRGSNGCNSDCSNMTATVKSNIEKDNMLVGLFVALKTSEDETFDEFYTKLNDIVNSKFNIGERVDWPKIVRKVLRSLLESFSPKVVARGNSFKVIADGTNKLDFWWNDICTYSP